METQPERDVMLGVRTALAFGGTLLLVAGCAVGAALEDPARGLSITGSRNGRPVPGTAEYQYWLQHDNDPAAMEIKLVRMGREIQSPCGEFYTVQDLCGSTYEIRALYTEGIVRSAANLADYHVGLRALPGSLTGYSLNLPGPGSLASTGVPRLRYAQQTLADDPLFPSLADGTRTINPTRDGSIYFLGQGILETAQANGFPPAVADAFDPEVSSRALGSAEDAQSLKLGFAAAERLFNTLWTAGVHYSTGTATTSLPPAVENRSLTDNTDLTTSRYYKWKFPTSATTFTLGKNLPLGRLVLDIRVVAANGTITDSGSTQTLLQNGGNVLTVTVSGDQQDLAGGLDLALPK